MNFEFLKKITKLHDLTPLLLFVFSILILIIVFLPYVYGYLNSPEGLKFMGLVHIPEDGCVYLNLINQAKGGNNLFFNRFTSEKHIPLYFNLFFLCLGKLAGLFDWPVLYAFYFARAAVILIFVYFSFYFLKYIFKDYFWSWYSLVLLTFGGGFGWLMLFFPNMPYLYASGYMAEGNVFFSLLTSPHFIFSIVFMTLSLFLFYLAWNKRSILYSFLGGFFGLILGMVHVYNLVIVWAVVILFGAAALFFYKKNVSCLIANFGFLFLFTSPWMLFNYYIVKNIYVYSKWYESYLHSPPPLDYLLSLGIIFIPFTVGVFLISDDKEKQKLFFLIWAVGQCIVMYMPFPFQRKLFEGFQIPVTILAVFGLIHITKKYFSKRGRTTFLSVFLILAVLNSVWLPLKIIKDVKHNMDYYLAKADWQAFEWMKHNTKEGDIVISSSATAKYIPAFLGRAVYLGHWSQTVDLNNKLSNSAKFYSGEYDKDEVVEFLGRSGINIVYLGVNEKEVFKIKELKYDCLEEVYDVGGVQIYKVI